MDFAKIQRSKGIIQGKKNNKINKFECDVCNKKVLNIKQQMSSYIIERNRWSRYIKLNYSFLCKTCHNKFSHDPSMKKEYH